MILEIIAQFSKQSVNLADNDVLRNEKLEQLDIELMQKLETK